MIKNKVGVDSISPGKWKAFFVFLFTLFLIGCFYPYEFNSVYLFFLPSTAYVKCLLFIGPLFLAFILTYRSKGKIQSVNILIFIQWFGLSLVSLKRGSFNAIVSQTILLFFLLLLLYFVRNTIGYTAFYKKYNRWIFLMALLGATAWFANTFFGFMPLYALPDVANPERLIYNYGLTFAVDDESLYFRYAGFFDEPGAMGLWGLYALIMNRLFIKEKWMEIPLVLCLLLTFSAGFIIQLLIYIILFSTSKGNRSRGVIIVVFLVIAYFLISLTRDTNLGFVYEMTLGRFEAMQNASDGSIFVDNRANSSEIALKEFLNNPILGTDRLDLELGNNIFEPLALYGVVGSLFILFPFFWLLFRSFKYKDYDTFKAGIVIISGFFHRPFHSDLLYYFILYGIIILFLERNRKILIT
jgi:hypothetical protein